MDWNSPVEKEGSPKVRILPAGDYFFRVAKLEKKESQKGNPMAALVLEIPCKDETGEDSVCDVYDYLVLAEKSEWKIASFFCCIGLKQPGEKIVPPWGMAVGSIGKGRFTIDDKYDPENPKLKLKDYLIFDRQTIPSTMLTREEFLKSCGDECPF
jgi:hypothetical protein